MSECLGQAAEGQTVQQIGAHVGHARQQIGIDGHELAVRHPPGDIERVGRHRQDRLDVADRRIRRPDGPRRQIREAGDLDSQVAARLVLGLVDLGLRPRRGVCRSKRAERRGQQDQQRRARGSEGPAGELPHPERADQSGTASHQPLTQLREQRHDAQREDRSRREADGGGGDKQRIQAHRAANGRRQRRPVLPELPQADAGQDDQRQVESHPLRERSVPLATDRLADGGEAPIGQHRREHQPHQACHPGCGGDEQAGQLDPRLDADAGGRQRSDHVEEPECGESHPRGQQHRRDDEQHALQERHPRDVPGRRAA